MLRVRLAARKATPSWAVIFLKTCLQFQEHTIFSCCGVAHCVHVQKEVDRHRAKPLMLSVGIKSGEKGVYPSVFSLH